ncbi:fasciclin domain-containing protein [Mongoliimonas terrestris]|uniref:fasciclin domain-containing protein n=1 Tax=Mongoliimonas terrestris TaxID=1709001 RepID=UPI000949954C|nr:fasciclin domain-containing protein [Mongoliimonas terrestris]
MTKNRTSLALRLAAVAFLGAASLAHAQEPPMVGGAPMLPSLTIPENASKADNLTTLVAAVTAAGLVDTLASDGPFTVFAPTNDAFAKLPAGTVDSLVKPEMKDTLTGILTYHVVAGNYTANAIAAAIDAGGGKAELKTVAGGTLTAMMKDGGVAIMDEAGNTAMVTQANVTQKNGVVHVIDTVLMPKA